MVKVRLLYIFSTIEIYYMVARVLEAKVILAFK